MADEKPQVSPLTLLIVLLVGSLALAAMCLGTAIVIFK